MSATLESDMSLGTRWRTQADEEVPLRSDLREIANHLRAVRAKLAEAGERDSAWRDEARRLIQAFTVDTATELLSSSYTTPASSIGRSSLSHFGIGAPANLAGTLITCPVAWPNDASQLKPWLAEESRHRIEPSDYVWYATNSDVTGAAGVVGVYEIDIPPKRVREMPRPYAPRAPGRGHDGLRAFEEIKGWLDISDKQTAIATGIGRTTKYSWERGTVARPSTVRTLFALREALSGFVRARGETQLHQWLHRPDANGETALDFLLRGDADAFVALLSDALFSAESALPQKEFTTFAPDPEPDPSPEPPALHVRPRRNRRRRDQ
jgi:hypothetical protein